MPTIVALRLRPNEIGRQELDCFQRESGPLSKDQDEMLNAVMCRMTQRITGSVARDSKSFPRKCSRNR